MMQRVYHKELHYKPRASAFSIENVLTETFETEQETPK